MCEGAIDLDAVPEAVMAGADARITALQADGLVERRGARLVATAAGQPFLRHFAACFDAYLTPSPARYSAAV